MTKVTISSWKPGFQKVSFTALLRELANLSLSRAHRVTTDVTEGREVDIQFPNKIVAEEFVRRAIELGADAKQAG